MRRAQVRFILGIKNMEGEIVIKRWEDLDGEVSSYRLCCLLRLTSTLIRLWSSYNILLTSFLSPRWRDMETGDVTSGVRD